MISKFIALGKGQIKLHFIGSLKDQFQQENFCDILSAFGKSPSLKELMIKGIFGDLTDEAKIDSFFKILAKNITI